MRRFRRTFKRKIFRRKRLRGGFRRAVKKVIKTSAEIKRRNETAAAAVLITNGTTPIVLKVIPDMAQGTTEFNRVGLKINVLKFKLSGLLTIATN